MESVFAWLTRHGAALRNLGAALVFVAVGVFLYAVRFGPARASAWFQGEAVLLAIIAVIAAALAAVFTYPAYRDWWRQQQRKPVPRLHIDIGNPSLANPTEVACGEHHEIKANQATYRVRVAVFNDGTGTLHNGTLNICVPEICSIETIDDPRIMHYTMPGTALNGELEPGCVVPARATLARDTFAPGLRMFHVQVRAPMDVTVPLVVTLGGQDMTPASCRITVRVSP